MNGRHGMDVAVARVGAVNCTISEITYAELLFGAEKSERKKHNMENLERFLLRVAIRPILPVIPVYAKERVRLERLGQPVDDFDLLIGATAIHHGLVLVTNNTKHFQRLQGIELEDWTR
ncbi:MAG: PIN domain-containing protein [Flavobacteriales bacterium]|nr:PIN domain-containing protein [Flavobacteriales bacterium]